MLCNGAGKVNRGQGAVDFRLRRDDEGAIMSPVYIPYYPSLMPACKP
jgi:hypothetical protein